MPAKKKKRPPMKCVVNHSAIEKKKVEGDVVRIFGEIVEIVCCGVVGNVTTPNNANNVTIILSKG